MGSRSFQESGVAVALCFEAKKALERRLVTLTLDLRYCTTWVTEADVLIAKFVLPL